MKTAWVVKSKVNGKYATDDTGIAGARLKDALVYPTREDARDGKYHGDQAREETVCKVALSKNGVPYKVLKTGQ